MEIFKKRPIRERNEGHFRVAFKGTVRSFLTHVQFLHGFLSVELSLIWLEGCAAVMRFMMYGHTGPLWLSHTTVLEIPLPDESSRTGRFIGTSCSH